MHLRMIICFKLTGKRNCKRSSKSLKRKKKRDKKSMKKGKRDIMRIKTLVILKRKIAGVMGVKVIYQTVQAVVLLLLKLRTLQKRKGFQQQTKKKLI